MIQDISQLYRRAFGLAARWPWLIALPVLAEGVQHVAEIRVGMYATAMTPEGQSVRIAFGLVKVLAIVLTIILAWRLWRFEGDVARVFRPTRALVRGIGLFLLVQFVGDAVALLAGRCIVALLGSPVGAMRLVALLPLLCWLLVSLTLFPWYVALAVEDRTMTIARSIRAVAGRFAPTLGLLLAGVLPLMALHYALGYAALGGAPVWPLMLVDTAVVGLLTAAVAASYFMLYDQVGGGNRHASAPSGANTA